MTGQCTDRSAITRSVRSATYSLAAIAAISLALHSGRSEAQQITERVTDASGEEAEVEQAWSHVGLLRARDLTPFGLLRLDMLPAHTADAKAGTWTFETQFAYQNTFVMSENVHEYLEARGVEREPLSPGDANAILGLPGDAYYFDGEVGLIDLIVQRRLNNYWSAYLTVPYIHYGEGVFDSAIESFHDWFGFSQQGREFVAKDRFQFVYGIGDAHVNQLDRETKGGFGDPVLGVRYSLPEPRFGWDMVVELAAKIAVDGERPLLSTGEDDYGAQITLQRRLGHTGRHALYLSGGGVYYAGSDQLGDDAHWIPTVILGYSFGLTQRTSVIVQGYASESVVQDTNIEELREDKYQISLGLQSRSSNVLWSLAITENITNFENTPDFGVQLGLAYMPRAK